MQNIVLATSGAAGLLHGVFFALLKHDVLTFDEYEEGLAELCDVTTQALLDQDVRNNRELAETMHLTLAMAGWSDKEQEMRAVRCARGPGALRFELHEIQTYALSPDGPWAEAAAKSIYPPPPDTPDKMFKAAKQQMTWWQSTHPQYPTGGRMLVAELTRSGLNLTARKLPEAARSRSAPLEPAR